MNKIFEIQTGGEKLFSIGFPKDSDSWFDRNSERNSKSQRAQWQPFSFPWDRSGRPKPTNGEPDFFYSVLGLFLRASFAPTFFPDSPKEIELLPVTVGGEAWFFINCLNTTSAYDEEKSDLKRFDPPNPRIFRTERLLITDPSLATWDLFTLEDSTRMAFIATEAFKSRVEASGAKCALEFREIGEISDIYYEAPRLSLEERIAQTVPKISPPPVRSSRPPAIHTDALLQQLTGLAHPALHLVTDDTGTAWSHIGGLPMLPLEFEWPAWVTGPMAFVAQINLAEIPSLRPEGLEALPTTGALYFFVDQEPIKEEPNPTIGVGWKVLFTPEAPITPPVEAPEALATDARYPELPVYFRPISTLPSIERLGIDGCDLADGAFDQIDALTEAPFESQPMHQIGGYPATIQDDWMELESQRGIDFVAGQTLLPLDDDENDALLDQARQTWRLLLQIDSDPRTNMMWDDGGILYFWIREADLTNKDFSKVWMAKQSY